MPHAPTCPTFAARIPVPAPIRSGTPHRSGSVALTALLTLVALATPVRAQSLAALVSDPHTGALRIVESDLAGAARADHPLSGVLSSYPAGRGGLDWDWQAQRFWVAPSDLDLVHVAGDGGDLVACYPGLPQSRIESLDRDPFYGLVAIATDGTVHAARTTALGCQPPSWILLLQSFPPATVGRAVGICHLRGVSDGSAVALTDAGELLFGAFAHSWSRSLALPQPHGAPPPVLPHVALAFDPLREEILALDAAGIVRTFDPTGQARRWFAFPLPGGARIHDATLRTEAARIVGTPCGSCLPELRAFGGDPALRNARFALTIAGAAHDALAAIWIGSRPGYTAVPGLCGPLWIDANAPTVLLGAFPVTSGGFGCAGFFYLPLPVQLAPPWLVTDFYAQALLLEPYGSAADLTNALHLPVR